MKIFRFQKRLQLNLLQLVGVAANQFNSGNSSKIVPPFSTHQGQGSKHATAVNSIPSPAVIPFASVRTTSSNTPVPTLSSQYRGPVLPSSRRIPVNLDSASTGKSKGKNLPPTVTRSGLKDMPKIS